MPCKLVVLYFVVYLFIFPGVFAQTSSDYSYVQQVTDELTYQYQSDVNLLKVIQFYQNDNWDSTIVSSSQEINRTNNQRKLDFYHYMRAISFRNKKVFTEAENNLLRTSDDFILKHVVSCVLGDVLLEQRKFEAAIFYYKRVNLEDSTQTKGIRISNVLHNIGVAYMLSQNFPEAEPYLLECTVLQEKEGDTSMLIGSYGDLANLYYNQYKDDLAIPYFERAYELAQSTNSHELKQNTALNMSVVEENRKDFIKALIYRKEYEQWRDSLNDQNRVWAIAQKEKEFAVDQKQKEVDLLQAENKAKIAERNSFLYAAVALGILLLLGFYFYREKVKSTQTITQQREELKELNTTKDKLFSIVSHDLRTSVNTLKANHSRLQQSYASEQHEQVESLLATNGSLASSTYHLLDNLFQWALMQTNQSYFSIEPLRLHFIVEQVSFDFQALFTNKGIQFSNQVAKGTTVMADQESLKIVLRNLLDNAVKYCPEGGEVNITASNEHDSICHITIHNTGEGLTPEAISLLEKPGQVAAAKRNRHVKGTGLGIQLCHQMMLKNLGKLTFQSTPGHSIQAIISLPLKTN